MNYGISSVEWVTALLRFNWLRNMRRGNCTQTDMCVYICKCVCVEGLGKDSCLSRTPEDSGMRDVPWVTSLQRAAVTHSKRSHMLAHTHTGSAYLERTCWNMTTTIQTLTIYGNLAHLPQRHLPSLVSHLTSPVSPFSL